MTQKLVVPFHVPSIGEEEINEVVATLRSGVADDRTAHRTVRRGIPDVRRRHSTRWRLNSCTAGLHLALAALELGPGDEGDHHSIDFLRHGEHHFAGGRHAGSGRRRTGRKPRPSVGPLTALPQRTRAIVPVHLAGLPCDMTALWSLARRYGLYVVEDAAHAAGSREQGWPIGAGNRDTGGVHPGA